MEVLLLHAENEENVAKLLATPLQDAKYTVLYQGTILVGDSFTEEVNRFLSRGGPVVLCGTAKAVGTEWAHRVVNSIRQNSGVRLFPVQMEQDAYMKQLSLDSVIATYWKDSNIATQDLLAAIGDYFKADITDGNAFDYTAEMRYRQSALESCDIIDLANLPENDRHLAARQLELRRLYVALHGHIEADTDEKSDWAQLEAIETRRANRIQPSIEADYDQEEGKNRVTIGSQLVKNRKLVVLGDPGAGKSTLLRWIATAYLLRLKQDPSWQDVPHVRTLPDEDWLPIIIRCRDIDVSQLNQSLDDILHFTLRRAEMADDECAALRRLLRKKLTEGRAMLLIDGLDEITDPALRARFCRQIGNIDIAFPDAPIVITSRIVGYKEMGCRIGRGFEHITVADLSKHEKDDFAVRWCAITELPENRENAARELINDIHSTSRIEQLTGNPMLLTTMALIKRKIGKLPSRRADLYSSALDVLLNWRLEVDKPLDYREAVPQLEFLAYAMCDRGVQQLREDEVISLLEQMREEYPKIRPVTQHTPEEFLHLLEGRTGIIVQAGHVRHNGRPVPVFEFRHLTFQEYLAGIALVSRHFPGRDRSLRLAEHVAPLAGRLTLIESPDKQSNALQVSETWREALRLCVACCDDDDVDSVLEAIISPCPGEDVAATTLPRVVLAALCLTDDSNASDDVCMSRIGAYYTRRDRVVETRQDRRIWFFVTFGAAVESNLRSDECVSNQGTLSPQRNAP